MLDLLESCCIIVSKSKAKRISSQRDFRQVIKSLLN